MSRNRAVGLMLVGLAVFLFLADAGALPIDLPLMFSSSTKTFNLDVDGVKSSVELTVSPELYSYYHERELGEAEVHIRNPDTGKNYFGFTNPEVGQLFDVQVHLEVHEKLMGLRGWQFVFVWDPSLFGVEEWTFGDEIFGSQEPIRVSNLMSGSFACGMVGSQYAYSVAEGQYTLAEIRMKILSTQYVTSDLGFEVYYSNGNVQCMFIGDYDGSDVPYLNVRWYNAEYVIGGLGAPFAWGDVPETAETYESWVTPIPFNKFAEDLKKLYPDPEDYVNAVLQIVQQLKYSTPAGPHYPTISLGRGWGDCDTWSILVASMLKAGGVKCILLGYTWGYAGHMNVGAALPQTPQDTERSSPFGFTIQNIKYWMVECTGQQPSVLGWRVGEIPDDALRSYAFIVFLNGVDTKPPPHGLSYTITDSEGNVYSDSGDIPPMPPLPAIDMWMISLGLGIVGIVLVAKG